MHCFGFSCNTFECLFLCVFSCFSFMFSARSTSRKRAGHGGEQHSCRGTLGPGALQINPWTPERIQGTAQKMCNTFNTTIPPFTVQWRKHSTELTVGYRCTTGGSTAFTNTTLTTWRSRSWPSVGTTATESCLAFTLTASTHFMSRFLMARGRGPRAEHSSLKHLKEVGEGQNGQFTLVILKH